MKHDRHFVADCAVRSNLVAVSTPSLAFSACFVERHAWRDVSPIDRLPRPSQDRHAGAFGAVVRNTHRRPTTHRDNGAELASNISTKVEVEAERRFGTLAPCIRPTLLASAHHRPYRRSAAGVLHRALAKTWKLENLSGLGATSVFIRKHMHNLSDEVLCAR